MSGLRWWWSFKWRFGVIDSQVTSPAVQVLQSSPSVRLKTMINTNPELQLPWHSRLFEALLFLLEDTPPSPPPALMHPFKMNLQVKMHAHRPVLGEGRYQSCLLSLLPLPLGRWRLGSCSYNFLQLFCQLGSSVTGCQSVFCWNPEVI